MLTIGVALTPLSSNGDISHIIATPYNVPVLCQAIVATNIRDEAHRRAVAEFLTRLMRRGRRAMTRRSNSSQYFRRFSHFEIFSPAYASIYCATFRLHAGAEAGDDAETGSCTPFA